VGYIACHLADLPSLRSVLWALATGCSIALLTSPAWARP
jgi:uncharacterized MAPEG superfamily protein